MLCYGEQVILWTDCLAYFEENLPGVCLAALLGMAVLGLGAASLTPISSQMWCWRSYWECYPQYPSGRFGVALFGSGTRCLVAGSCFTDKKLLRLAIVLMGLYVQADLLKSGR